MTFRRLVSVAGAREGRGAMRTLAGVSRLVAGLSVVLVVGLVAPALAVADATYTVNTIADTNAVNPAVSPLDSSGNTSLRSILEYVNVIGHSGTVTIDVPAGTYTLTSAGGAGQGTSGELVLDPAGAATPPGSVAIDGAGATSTTIDANHLDRALEIGSGTVSISGLTFAHASSADGVGGAIHAKSGASLAVSDSTFADNAAGGPGGAGAGSGIGSGGAILANGPLTVTDSTFTGNTAGGNGGAGAGSGQGFGGAIDGGSGLTVTGSTFAGNKAGGDGGSGASSGLGDGGAIACCGTSMTVTDSTFVGNRAGGAGGSGGAGSGAGFGGALYLFATSTLSSDTIDGNSVGSSAGSAGSGIVGASGVTAVATIVSGNTGAPNCLGHVASASFSLEGPAGSTSCGFDLVSADPLLGALADNGGPTETQALPSGSPAVDVVPAASCPTSVDQRGLPRPDNGEGFCDVGAFELQDPVATSTAYTGPTVILAGHSVTLSGRLTTSGGSGVSGRSLTLSAGGRSCLAGPTNSGGYASCTVTASSVLGPVSVSASFAGDGSYLASSSGAQPAVQFAFPATGAFLIGDQTAAGGVGTTVTFYGYRWAVENVVSGDPGGGTSLGSGDSGFYGFAGSVGGLPARTPPLSCSGGWSASQIGSSGSAAAPGAVPSYMGVLVTGQVNGSGFLSYSGGYGGIVVVHVTGYSSDPAVGGTGKIVAGYC